MRERLSISDVRASLPRLLKRLQKEPQTVFEITVNGLVMGELLAPETSRLLLQPGGALLEAMEVIGEPEVNAPADRSVAREHDTYLLTLRS